MSDASRPEPTMFAAARSKLSLLLLAIGALLALGATGCAPYGYYSAGYSAGYPSYSTYGYSPGYGYGYGPYSYGGYYGGARVYAPARYYAPHYHQSGGYHVGPHAARPYGGGYVGGRGPVVVTPPRR